MEVDARRAGIIPAYAGSTEVHVHVDPANEDHPRIRGEHALESELAAELTGSSPHTRGAPRRSASRRSYQGIIPAYAGSTLPMATRGLGRRDHPRIRGEHGRGSMTASRCVGSSPHTRGALIVNALDERLAGIIPAYAGSTGCCLCCLFLGWDHPRIRGEHGSSTRMVASCGGSSPHTRGAHQQHQPVPAQHGIIPAYAGSTRPW